MSEAMRSHSTLAETPPKVRALDAHLTPERFCFPVRKWPALPTAKSKRAPACIYSFTHSFIDSRSRTCVGFSALGSGVSLPGLESPLCHLGALWL